MSHLSHLVTPCNILDHLDSGKLYSLYTIILVDKEASNDNMLVIDANCMPEGATELILTGQDWLRFRVSLA